MAFPKDFLWGAATASYQIEGAALEDGRGECTWTRFSHTPGKVHNGDTGDVACNHYHLYRDDVALMKQLGLQAYRFSVSWPRILPQGTGAVNPAGLDFYDRLVDELLKAGIQPWITLYHWDLPQVLEDRGGWTTPDMVGWFTEYADVVTKRLGDRVQNWMTHNEPICTSFLGYLLGMHAPGLKDMGLALRAAHQVLVAHGAAVPVIRRNVPGARVGIVLNPSVHEPASNTEEDRQAVLMADAFENRIFLDPLYKGAYPAEALPMIESLVGDLDLSNISVAAAPTDFLGVNYYTRVLIAYDPDAPNGQRRLTPAGVDKTEMDWEIYPQGLTNILVRLHRDYAPKALYVTENGAAFIDPTPTNGTVDDPRRVEYLKTHFAATEAAIAQGVPVKGFFVWSLLDNFEWSYGYSKRFGIIHVDYATLKRTPKASARYFQSVIASHA